ncbi:MAG: sigma-54-dependent Fis family transcriptional regulator [Ardenticatenales bacterium]|nr:sigma-54-dependent Fis family transcriptional regulator [Ardenticatenales bacterium]
MTPPTLLVVDDESIFRDRIARALAPAGYRILQAEDESGAQRIIESESLDMAFLDLTLRNEDSTAPLTDRGGWRIFTRLRHLAPEVSVVVVTSDGAAGTAVRLLQQGALDYYEKHGLTRRSADADLQRLAEVGIARTRVGRAAPAVPSDKHPSDGEPWVGGDTAAMREVERRVASFAPFDIGVLILGRNGTGKDMLAEEIHRRSPRGGRKMVAVNCAAIPRDLLESQLFGHEKGSFSGAIDKHIGLMEAASGSTLFLDEIAEMDADLQAKLLRALQHKRIRRVGGTQEIDIDIRVIAATNQDIAAALESGALRTDLYYRIAGTEITLPGLTERLGDIVALAQHFLAIERAAFNPDATGFTSAAQHALCAYDWPGNVRQLRSEVISGLILSRGQAEIDIAHLSPKVTIGQLPGAALEPSIHARLAAGLPAVLPPDGLPLVELRDAWERSMIEQALVRHAGNIAAVARTLHVSRDQVTHRCQKFDLDPRAFADA